MKIQGWLLRENVISSHVKATCYFHKWKDHHFYGYIIHHAFHSKKLFKWNGLAIIDVFIIKRKLITRLLGNKKFFFCAHSWNIFQHSQRNLVTLRGHVISSMHLMFTCCMPFKLVKCRKGILNVSHTLDWCS